MEEEKNIEQEENNATTQEQENIIEDNIHVEAEKISENDDASESGTTDNVEDTVENGNHRGRKRRAERQIEELNDKVEEMGMKLAEMNDKYMRIYSEYENYRKRTNAEKAGLILNGGKDVIKLMLPVIDDMERALTNMSKDDSSREGMELILKNMLNALQQKGLKAMDVLGVKFDENYHEAITQIPSPSPETKGTVIDVIKKGYFLNDEVLRFAQVVVAN